MKKENTHEGYIQLSRSIRHSEIWQLPPLHLKVWIWLLCKATHKDDPKKRLKRGQCLATIPETIEAMKYHVGYRAEKPSKRQVWVIYEGLRERNMIVTTKVTRGMIVTICNYDYYQDANNYEGYKEGSAKVTRRLQQGNTRDKNVKNEKNEKKTTLKDLVATNGVAPSTPGEIAFAFFDQWKHPEKRGSLFEKYAAKLGDELDPFCEHWTDPISSSRS